MELSSPSSLNTTAGGGGHDHHESESEDSAEENNPKCRVQFISDSSYEDDDHINELEHTDSDNQHTKFFHDVTDMVLQGLKRKRRRKSMRKESRKRAKFGIQLAGGNEAEIVPKAYSRCNVHYLHEVIRSFRNCERKCGLIRGAGFGDILQFDGCNVPRSFAQWIADCTNVRSEEVCGGEQRIQLGTEHVASIVGIPSAGLTIQTTGEDGKISFLASIGLKELPPIKFFGSKVMNEDLPDDMFIRCVLVVVLSTFLCPTSSTFPSTKYLGALVDLDKIKDMDWAKLMHNWMINCIKKYQKQRAKRKRLTCTLGGCIYSLAVRCLDEVDFEGIHLEQTLPRILVWKGDMIIQYSKLYMCPNGKYGFLPVKENNKSSFSIANKKESREKLLMELKNFLECAMTQSLSSEVKENVVSIFDAYMGTEDEHCWEKAKRLLTDVLMSITTNCNIMLKEEHHNGNIGILSGDTEVAGSSQEASYNCEGASDSTLKVDSDGASTNEGTRLGTTNGERKKEQPPHSGDKAKQDSMEHKDVTTTQFESGNKGGDGMHFAHTVQEFDGTNGNVTGLSNPIMPTVMELDTYAKDVNKDVHLTDHQYEKTSKLPTTDTSAVQNEIALHVPPKPGNIVLADTISFPEVTRITKGSDFMTKPQKSKETSGILNAMEETQPPGDKGAKVVIANKFCNEATVPSSSNQSASLNHMLLDDSRRADDTISVYYEATSTAIVNNIMQKLEKPKETTMPSWKVSQHEEVMHDTNQLATSSDMANINKDEANKKSSTFAGKTMTCLDVQHTDQVLQNTSMAAIAQAYPCSETKSDSDKYALYDEQCRSVNSWCEADFSEEYVDKSSINNKENIHPLTSYYASPAYQARMATYGPQQKLNESDIQCAQKQQNNGHCSCAKTVSPIKPRKLLEQLDSAVTVRGNGNQHFNEGKPEDPINIEDSEELEILDEESYSKQLQEKQVQRRFKGAEAKLPEISNAGDASHVQFLGERKFRETCNILTDKTDQMYNQANNKRRVLQPSKWVCSPYETGKVNVRNDEARLYQCIMALGSSREYKYRIAIYFDKVRVSFKTFADSFRPEGWVEGYVLNTFCHKLFRDNHPRESLKHFFFHTMSEYFLEKYTTDAKREKMKVGVMHAFEGAGSAMKLHLSNMLYFPTLNMQHWFLFIVDLRDEKFIVLDSLFGPDNILHRESSQLLIKNFIKAWYDRGLPRLRFEDYDIMFPRVPKQNNGHDCGIFVMKFMELWDPRNQPSCAFSKDDITSIRIKICNDLMFSNFNIQEDAKNFAWNYVPSMYIPGSK